VDEIVVECVQLVSPDDDCCASPDPCGMPATWVHRFSGAALCDLHEQNAREFSSGGEWRVGEVNLSYPDGWESIAPAVAQDAAPAFEVVRFDS